MTLFSRDRRRTGRPGAEGAVVVFRVRDGRDPARLSVPVEGHVRDLTDLGMSVLTPRIAPSGLHVMYDTLMLVRNTVEAEVSLPAGDRLTARGKVVWFRAASEPPGHYLFGMSFDVPPSPGAEADAPLAGSESTD